MPHHQRGWDEGFSFSLLRKTHEDVLRIGMRHHTVTTALDVPHLIVLAAGGMVVLLRSLRRTDANSGGPPQPRSSE